MEAAARAKQKMGLRAQMQALTQNWEHMDKKLLMELKREDPELKLAAKKLHQVLCDGDASLDELLL